MSCDLFTLANKGVGELQPYSAGKSIEELQRELGLNDIIKLASNENPLGISRAVSDAITSKQDLSRYPDGNGFRLKKCLADKHNIAGECITLGNGSNDILELVARTFVNVEHEVIYARHAFAVYSIVTQSIGAEHVIVKANQWGHDLPAMLNAISDKTRLIFIANPNNPTGTWLNKHELRRFIEAVPENIIVLVDEAYFEYAITEELYPDCSFWLKDFPNLIVTRTFSKAYGLAGLRIGYSLSHPDVANLLNRVRQPFNNNSLALVAAETALQDTAYIEQSVEVNRRGIEQMISAFNQLGLSFIPSKGNFICVDLAMPAEGVYQSLLESGVIVRPVANYGMPNHLRVSIGQANENSRFIERLTAIIEQQS